MTQTARRDPSPAAAAADYDCGAARLREAIEASCDPTAPFARQVETALGTALALLAADPELADLLLLEPFRRSELFLHSRKSARSYAALLRDAAARAPAVPSHPPLLEPALIDGLTWQLYRHLKAGSERPLSALLPELLEVVLVCYLGPPAARRACAAASTQPLP